ncbi:hypothetical protein ACPPVQ_12925 [Diaminobutyricibacter sp. McL0618]|uniref:hypothetical protein n=1 Tax=Leifsonia sp. McL0618 TaxID=3415677 RepID=UPI003CEF207F
MTGTRTYTAVLKRRPGSDEGEEVEGVEFEANGLPQRTYGQTTVLVTGYLLDEKFELEGPQEVGASRYSYRLIDSEEYET